MNLRVSSIVHMTSTARVAPGCSSPSRGLMLNTEVGLSTKALKEAGTGQGLKMFSTRVLARSTGQDPKSRCARVDRFSFGWSAWKNSRAGPIERALMTHSRGSASDPKMRMRTGSCMRPRRAVDSTTVTAVWPIAGTPPSAGSQRIDPRFFDWSSWGSTCGGSGVAGVGWLSVQVLACGRWRGRHASAQGTPSHGTRTKRDATRLELGRELALVDEGDGLLVGELQEAVAIVDVVAVEFDAGDEALGPDGDALQLPSDARDVHWVRRERVVAGQTHQARLSTCGRPDVTCDGRH